MNHYDTQSIALEVRGISLSLKSLQESRDKNDKRSDERADAMESKIEIIGKDIAASHEFKRQLLDDLKDLKGSVKDLTEMSNKAKGGWWAVAALSTVFSVLGSGLTLIGSKLFK